jgi:hypothetical protein
VRTFAGVIVFATVIAFVCACACSCAGRDKSTPHIQKCQDFTSNINGYSSSAVPKQQIQQRQVYG